MLKLLKKILPPTDEEFFILFEKAANNCKDTAELFCKINEDGLSDEYLEEARKLKHLSAAISKKLLYKLNNTFITPIDREDIQYLANLFNKITKKIVKACFNLKVYRIKETTPNMKKQAYNLRDATEHLISIISLVRNVSQIKEATKINSQMKEIETKGDEILHMALDNLFSGKYEALDVIKYRDVHKDIESALDTCYSVTDEVLSVMLKHS